MALDEADCNERSGRQEPPDRENSKGKNKGAAKKEKHQGRACLPARTLEAAPESLQKPEKQKQILA